MAPNVPAIYEAHFGVPMIGAVLNTLNIRLDAEAIAFLLAHGEAKVLITDREFSATIQRALQTPGAPACGDRHRRPAAPGRHAAGRRRITRPCSRKAIPTSLWTLPEDEWDAIALNYTSGTTGNPKGVVTHHRGAYLNALSNIVSWGMPAHPVYLWTLPMFHCNGWCFPWTMAAAPERMSASAGSTRKRLPAIREHGVTHMCGAPIVYNMLINAPASCAQGIGRRSAAMVPARRRRPP